MVGELKPIGPYLKGQVVGYVERADGTKPFLPQGYEPPPARVYSGYPEWFVLRVDANSETRPADWLKRVDVHVYLPSFKKSHCRRGGLRYRRLSAVMPGLLFVPCEMIEIPNRDEIFEWAGVYGLLARDGRPLCLIKSDIDEIRRIEAKLNKPESPVDAVGKELEQGQRVRFIDPRTVRLFGEGVVFEVVSDHRIGVEVQGLFGGPTKTYISADEIEVM